MPPAHFRWAGALVIAVLVASCTGSSSAAGQTTGPSAATHGSGQGTATTTQRPTGPWPTYHGNNRRSGVSSAAALRSPLHRAWARGLDGAVYAQPIVIGGLVIVATENNTVYALRRHGGHVVWQHHLGTPVPLSALPCGNINPLGITGAPAYDAATGSVFVVTETTGAHHTLRALNWRNGHQRWHRSLDVLPHRDRTAEQQRAALLVAHHRVYAAFGGLAGDCGNYVGFVAGVPTDGTGGTVHYAVPTEREAGIWAAAGPVQAKHGGPIYVASGNGAETNGTYDGSDSVIELSSGLRKLGLFAPSTWQEDNAQDLDLGSSSPVPTSAGIVIAGKRGTVYLLSSLNGVGRQRATLSGCAAYGGGAATGPFAVLPCTDGIRRLDSRGSGRWDWQVSGVDGSPVIARGVVYALDTGSGELVEVSLRTGHVRARLAVGSVSRFATPTPVGSSVYVGTSTGVVAVHGAK